MALTRQLTRSLTRSLTRKLTGEELNRLFLEKFKLTLSDTELVTNGTFDADSNWTKGTGWSIANGVAASDGSQSANSGLIQSSVHTSGKTYTLTFDVVSTNGEQIKFWVNGAQNIFGSALTVGTHTYTYTATATGTAYFEATTAFVGSIDNVSVKEVIKQAPLAAFSLRKLGDVSPYAARIRRSSDNTEAQVMFDASDRVSESSVVRNTSQNLLLYSEGFSQSAYSKINSGIQDASQIVDPFGGNNAVRLAADTTNGQHRLDIATSVGTGSHTFSVYAKAADYGSIWLRRQGSSSVFNLENGTVLSDGGNNNPTITDVGNGWYRVSITNTGSANDTFRINFAPTDTPTSDYAGTNTSGIYIFGTQLEETVTYESTPSGSNLVTNGTFDADSNWIKQSGWSIANGKASSDGSQSLPAELYQSSAVAAGNRYRITFDVLDLTAGQVRMKAGTTADVYRTSNGSYSADLTVTASHVISFEASSTFVGSIDNVVVKILPPIPSEYISTPVVSNDGLTFTESTLDTFVGGENLLRNSEDFSSVWNVANGAITANQGTDPNGGNGADLFKPTSDQPNTVVYQTATGVTGETYVTSVYAKASGKNFINMRGVNDASGYAWFNLSNGTVGTVNSSIPATIEAVGNDWYRCSVTQVADSTTEYFVLTVNDADASMAVTVNGNDGVLLWGAQLNTDSLKTYQATTGTARDGNASVVVLYNQTGGEDAIQGTTAHQPLLHSAGLLVRSGTSPAINFIGGNPQRSLVFNGLTGIAHLDAFFVQDSSDNTYIYPSSGNGSYFGIIATQNSTSTDVVRSPYGTPTLEVNGTAPSISNTGGNWSALNGRKLAYHRSASTASWPEVNFGNTFGVNTEWNLGAQVSGGGEIKFAEIIFFDSDQHANQAAIEADINDFHNIF